MPESASSPAAEPAGATAPVDAAAGSPGDIDDQPTHVANEFADVTVRKVQTRNGVRLEIAAPRRGYVIQLCALELEALASQPKRALSDLLARPIPPDGDLG